MPEPAVPRARGRWAAGAFERPDAPRLAIIIDDWGYPWRAADAILSLPVPLTTAIIPHLPMSRHHAQAAAEAGHEVILHLPMEAMDSRAAQEPGTIRVDMTESEIRRQLAEALRSVPEAVGVNNHMGSRATADRRVMYTVLEELERRGLFFVDSYTTRQSVAGEVAQAIGLPYAVNSLFLDHDPDEEAVVAQLRAAIELARRQGEAVAIGHVRPQTYRALVRVLPEIWAAGIELVYASDIAGSPRNGQRRGLAADSPVHTAQRMEAGERN